LSNSVQLPRYELIFSFPTDFVAVHGATMMPDLFPSAGRFGDRLPSSGRKNTNNVDSNAILSRTWGPVRNVLVGKCWNRFRLFCRETVGRVAGRGTYLHRFDQYAVSSRAVVPILNRRILYWKTSGNEINRKKYVFYDDFYF
jgi:hypothetical protein